MIAFAWYLLKVIICSGILCGYYYIALQNKIFHRWNRFYLLASMIIALSVPLMKINIFHNANSEKGNVIKILQTISSGDEIIIEYSKHGAFPFTSENIVTGVYFLITIIFLSVFFIALYKITRLRKKYPETSLEGINFIATDAKGTPFSFFNSIFWNNAIDIYSRQGQQIFNHEIAHVKEKHSYDKIFMNVVLIFFWINPFFWLIQKELSMIHEFIADKEALEDDDISSFAEMILQTVYPGKQFSVTNNFFHSPLKRRLIMFTKNKNPKASYFSRLLVLPLAAIVFLAFTLKMKTIYNFNKYDGKKITVIIDAGHGGDDNGAVENNVKEKDLNLAIAKEIKRLNKNENIDIILSRENDEAKSVKDRVIVAEEKKADLFISIHVDAEEKKNNHNGVVIFIPKNDNSYLKESKLLGSALIKSFKDNYQLKVAGDLQQREQGIWILKANMCPSVLLETGFLSSQSDFEYLINPENQKIIAQNVLNGIEKYAEQNIGSTLNRIKRIDTIPSEYYTDKTIRSLIISEKEDSVFLTYKDGRKESITKAELYARKILLPPPPPPPPPQLRVPPNGLYLLDGKVITYKEARAIDPDEIQSINVLKGKEAKDKYGEKGKNGVVEIIKKDIEKSGVVTFNQGAAIDSKSKLITFKEGTIITKTIQKDTVPDKLFTEVENEANFPGGHEAWIKYIVSKIQLAQDSLTQKDFGTCLVKFIVGKDGSVSNVEATTMKASQLAKIAVDAIKKGPKWIPASQNDRVVASYRLQPVTLTEPK
ncbi:MAG: N-acetylmuramoyl-L-alanine amidase [Ginsengibacter sp.]